jgi:hypothetical protein
MDELNRRGIDAMIVSPFTVNADYGAQFVVEFANTLRRRMNAGEQEVSLLDLFRTSADNAAKKLSQFPEMDLEFILLGDHNVRLCGKTSSDNN